MIKNLALTYAQIQQLCAVISKSMKKLTHVDVRLCSRSNYRSQAH